MENVADALKIAAAVAMFVIALSIIIFSFGQVRESADIILDYRDRETSYIDGDYYYETTGTERTVDLETIIPSIFRSYLENYKIVFDGLQSPIYKIKNRNGDMINKYTLDLETNQNRNYNNVVLANNEQKSEFIRGILYNDFINGENAFETKFKVQIDTSLYNQLKNANKITEYLGVYYQNDNEDVPDVMKTEKRIITYKVEY